MIRGDFRNPIPPSNPMDFPDLPHFAWLENAQGGRYPLHATCRIGRAEGNDLVLPDQRISRRHAMVHMQGDREFWLVDFGSRNGTYLNGCRIAQPTRLLDGNTVSLGSTELVFHQADKRPDTQIRNRGELTVYDVRQSSAWLLVADVIGSTQMVANLAPDELPLVMGQWLVDCREVIENRGGRINQFMGDGFFAYWPDGGDVETRLLAALEELRQMQAKGRPEFRIVLHLGLVVLGGVAIGEEERISGGEVHFTFRMEKLAGKLGARNLLSQPARDRLAAYVTLKEQGRHPLQGFDGDHAMYSF